MAKAALNKNGDGTENPQLGPDVIKIFVVGEQRCGKTSFIRTFAGDIFAGQIYTEYGTTIYPYNYYHFGVLRKFAFVEVPDLLEDDIGTAIYSHVFAKGCVFMYAIDDPSSLQALRNKWIPALAYFTSNNHIPTMAVGYKADQRDDQQVINRLALANLSPVTAEEGLSLTELPQIKRYFECSQNDELRVAEACAFMLKEAYDLANPQ